MKSVSFFNKKIIIFLISIVCGFVLVGFSLMAVIKVFYPVCYLETVKVYAKKYNLETSLVLAIINTESGFNRFALSNKGAVGLMQIMPSTAKSIAEELEIPNFNTEQLLDSNTNIRFGCYYLRYLYDKFNSPDEILFAYNAGEGRLQTLLNENGGEFDLNDIEIEETKSYIEKVNRAVVFYKNWHNL